MLRQGALLLSMLTPLPSRPAHRGWVDGSGAINQPGLPLRILLQDGKDIRFGDWTQHDVNWLNTVNVRLLRS